MAVFFYVWIKWKFYINSVNQCRIGVLKFVYLGEDLCVLVSERPQKWHARIVSENLYLGVQKLYDRKLAVRFFLLGNCLFVWRRGYRKIK